LQEHPARAVTAFEFLLVFSETNRISSFIDYFIKRQNLIVGAG